MASSIKDCTFFQEKERGRGRIPSDRRLCQPVTTAANLTSPPSSLERPAHGPSSGFCRCRRRRRRHCRRRRRRRRPCRFEQRLVGGTQPRRLALPLGCRARHCGRALRRRLQAGRVTRVDTLDAPLVGGPHAGAGRLPRGALGRRRRVRGLPRPWGAPQGRPPPRRGGWRLRRFWLRLELSREVGCGRGQRGSGGGGVQGSMHMDARNSARQGPAAAHYPVLTAPYS
jgi:hypothetical protein